MVFICTLVCLLLLNEILMSFLGIKYILIIVAFRTSLMKINNTIVAIVVYVIFAALIQLAANPSSYSAFAVGETQQVWQPDIKASDIYQYHTMVLGKDIKNLVILLPNEGHEDPTQPKELRVVNQPYLPQNAVVNVGTMVTWFNGDVGHHHHTISLVDNNSKNTVYDSGPFDNFAASKPIKFNNTGTFVYSGPSDDKAVPNYRMNGTVTVVDQSLTTSFNSTSNATDTTSAQPATATNNIDTIATLMVPAKLLDKVVSEVKGQGFGIDNQYPFTSLRGGGSTTGGDKNQVMLVLTSSGKTLNEVISALSIISPTMPYA
jgi:plastocyanin